MDPFKESRFNRGKVPELDQAEFNRVVREAARYEVAYRKVEALFSDPTLSRDDLIDALAKQMAWMISYYEERGDGQGA